VLDKEETISKFKLEFKNILKVILYMMLLNSSVFLRNNSYLIVISINIVKVTLKVPMIELKKRSMN